MIDDSVATEEITAYLRSLVPPRNAFLQELETRAAEEFIPVIQPETAQLIHTLFKLSDTKTVLEIGTAIGYSAIVFAMSLPKNSHVTTIEIKPEVVAEAEKNIEAAGMKDKISVVCGDAAEVLSGMDGEFDCVFLDAAKGQYINFLPKCLKLLKSGGVLISDNILYRGTVAQTGFIPRKHRTIIRNLKEYLYLLSNDEGLTTTVIPIGDGLAVSVKN